MLSDPEAQDVDVLRVAAICILSQFLLLGIALLFNQAFGGLSPDPTKRSRVPRRRLGMPWLGHTMELIAGDLASSEAIVEQRFLWLEWMVFVTGGHTRIATKFSVEEWPSTKLGKQLLERPSARLKAVLKKAHETVARRIVQTALAKDEVDLWRLIRAYAAEMLAAAFNQKETSFQVLERYLEKIEAVFRWPSFQHAKAKLPGLDGVALFEIASRYRPLTAAAAVAVHYAGCEPSRWRADPKAVCAQAYRQRAPVMGVFRVATETFNLGQFHIPKGAKLYCDQSHADRPYLDDLCHSLVHLLFRLLQPANLKLKRPEAPWHKFPTMRPTNLRASKLSETARG